MDVGNGQYNSYESSSEEIEIEIDICLLKQPTCHNTHSLNEFCRLCTDRNEIVKHRTHGATFDSVLRDSRSPSPFLGGENLDQVSSTLRTIHRFLMIYFKLLGVICYVQSKTATEERTRFSVRKVR